VLIAKPIIGALFEHGAFTPSDTAATSGALTAFAIGLPAFVLIKVFAPGFFAREDTATPMRFAILSVAVNLSAALVLSRWWGHVGIAFATALAAWTNATALGVTLARRGHYVPDLRIRTRFPRIVVSGLIMGGVLLALRAALPLVGFDGTTSIDRMVRLAVLLFAGMAAYFLAGHFLKAMTFADLRTIWRPR
jgi:putative peptidoglycan lipid II flippase